jgi:alanine racemase
MALALPTLIYRFYDSTANARPTVAEIDLAALRRNAARLRALAGAEVGLMAVVKADAYGHGALACARALSGRVFGFAVSLVEEGLELRAGDIREPILVLGSSLVGAHADLIAHGLTPLIGEEIDLERFADAAIRAGVRLGFHLDIDTGMSRLGVRIDRLAHFLGRLRSLPALDLLGVCTHLPDADGDDAEVTRGHLAAFERARRQIAAAGFCPRWVHASSSAGLIRFPDARYSLCRPGLALYGYATVHGLDLEPVMTLRSRVVALGELAPTKATRTALVPIGYADGYPRPGVAADVGPEALVGGSRARVVAVSMNMTLLEVAAGCRLGEAVVLLGAQGGQRIGADELARRSGRIPWEILSAVAQRVPRAYLDDEACERA